MATQEQQERMNQCADRLIAEGRDEMVFCANCRHAGYDESPCPAWRKWRPKNKGEGVKSGFTVQKGGPLKSKAQSDPAGDAYGYVESVINDCTPALKAIEADHYDGALADLQSASSFLSEGMNILRDLGEHRKP